MIMKVLAYKDTKLNIFGQPFYFDGDRSKEDLIEITRRMCSNPEMPLRMFEYDLYELGEFDDKVGVFKTHDPEFYCSLGDFKHLAASTEEKVDVVG